MGSEIKFVPFQDTEEAIDKIAIVPGRILYTTDTKRTFLDIGRHRIEFNIVDKTLDENSDNPISNAAVSKKFSEIQQSTYELPIASDVTLGGVRIGNLINIDENGIIDIIVDNEIVATSKNPISTKCVAEALKDIRDEIEKSKYELPIASTDTLGGVKIGNGIKITSDGKISVGVVADQELDELSQNAIANTVVTVKFEEVERKIQEISQETYVLPTATTQTKGGIIVGKYLDMDDEGRLNITIDPNLLKLDSELDILSNSPVKNRAITQKFNEVEEKLKPATSESLGRIKVGKNLEIEEDGTLNAIAEPYDLPIASDEVLGGIKVGQNLTIDENGVLNAEGGISDIPIASKEILGGVIVGEGLEITQEGILSAQGRASSADKVTYNNTTSLIEATNVQEAIDSLAKRNFNIQEITKVDYDKLSEEQKKNGTLYFIIDWSPMYF